MTKSAVGFVRALGTGTQGVMHLRNQAGSRGRSARAPKTGLPIVSNKDIDCNVGRYRSSQKVILKTMESSFRKGETRRQERKRCINDTHQHAANCVLKPYVLRPEIVYVRRRSHPCCE